jgi:hypothetical protein
MTARDRARRLDALATVYQRGREKPAWLAPIEATADRNPRAFALWRVAFVLAQRRYLAETGQQPYNIADRWDEWDPRVDAELERFAEVGWDAWLAEGRDLPPVPGWPTDLAAFYADEVERTARDAADAGGELVRLGWRP